MRAHIVVLALVLLVQTVEHASADAEVSTWDSLPALGAAPPRHCRHWCRSAPGLAKPLAGLGFAAALGKPCSLRLPHRLRRWALWGELCLRWHTAAGPGWADTIALGAITTMPKSATSLPHVDTCPQVRQRGWRLRIRRAHTVLDPRLGWRISWRRRILQSTPPRQN